MQQSFILCASCLACVTRSQWTPCHFILCPFAAARAPAAGCHRRSGGAFCFAAASLLLLNLRVYPAGCHVELLMAGRRNRGERSLPVTSRTQTTENARLVLSVPPADVPEAAEETKDRNSSNTSTRSASGEKGSVSTSKSSKDLSVSAVEERRQRGTVRLQQWCQ